jgi:iron complex outermembrane recepter protein
VDIGFRTRSASLLLLGVLAAPAAAQTGGPVALTQLPPLKQMSLEQLLQVEVSLPLRDPVPARRAPAAVSVMTHEDIRRSGAATLPEVLRYAPGLFVGRYSASSWVVTSRGFAGTSANKLLVMRDGRTVYSPLFSGVFWEVQDALLGDLARIEVIRGPGGALWGANAVNGIINIVARPASETQGLHVTAGGGLEERGFGAVRYGGTVGTAAYRVFSKVIERDQSLLPSGGEAGDWHRVGHAGFRVDVGPSDDAFTVQGEAASARAGLGDRGSARTTNGHLLARWTRRAAGRGELQIQGYFDRSTRLVPGQMGETRRTGEFDLQHRFSGGPRHRVTWGALYRTSADETTPALLEFVPAARTTTLASAFLQDEIRLSPAWSVTLGTRLERNAYTGVEWQPSIRARWLRGPQTFWTAVSRAVRLPTRLETDVRVVVGGNVVIVGNPDLQSETLVAYEAGYRVQPRPFLDVDVAAFVNDYDRLRTRNLPAVPGAPIVLGNDLRNRSRGVELGVRVQPVPAVRGTASYAFLRHDLTITPGVIDTGGGRADLGDPTHQVQVHGRIDLPRALELDLFWRRVGELPAPGAPPWSDLTVRVGWRPHPDVDLSLVGRDLLHDRHREFANPAGGEFLLRRAVFTSATVVF